MRALSWLLLALLLSGCSETPSEPSEVNDVPAGDETEEDAGNDTVAPLADLADGNFTDVNGTIANETVANVTPRARVILFQESFTGLLPVDGLSGEHSFAVPADADLLEVIYTSEHVGLFGAIARVKDPQQATRLDSLEICSTALAPGAETTVCPMALEEPLLTGDWGLEVIWQVGEVTEQYTLDVTVWGYAPLAA